MKDFPLHRIPNLVLATLGTRIHINVFFPALLYEDRPHRGLTQPEIHAWLTRIIYPAGRAAQPAGESSWPVTYETETHLRKIKSFHTVLLHRMDARNFGLHIHDLTSACRQENDLLWTEGLFFVTSVRGTKDISRFGLDEINFDDAHRESLESALQGLSVNVMMMDDNPSSKFWVDVGLEAGLARRTVVWRTDAHSKILRYALNQHITQEVAVDETQLGSHKYERDLYAHILDISGFRYTVCDISSYIVNQSLKPLVNSQ